MRQKYSPGTNAGLEGGGDGLFSLRGETCVGGPPAWNVAGNSPPTGSSSMEAHECVSNILEVQCGMPSGCPMELPDGPHSDTDSVGHPVTSYEAQALPPSVEILRIFRRYQQACGHAHREEERGGVEVRGGVGDASWEGRAETRVALPPESVAARGMDDRTYIPGLFETNVCCDASATDTDVSASIWAAVALAQHDEYEKRCLWLQQEEEGGYAAEREDEYGQDDESRPLLCSPAA